MKKDTKIIKAIVQCILEYSMLKSGNISTEIPSGVAYQLPTRDFIRAWMQSHYNIIKLSGYFYRRFKKIFDNVDYWKEQIDQNNQNENNINETFNNDIQAQKDNIENTLAELGDLSKQEFITKIISKLKDNGFIVNIDNNNHNYSNFSFGEIKDANFNDHNHYDVPEILISWFSTKRSHGKAGYAILCIKLYDDYFGFSGTIYRQKSTTNFKDFIHTDFESSIIFPKNQDDSVNDVSCIIPFKGLNTKDAFWRYTYNYHNLYSLIETINYLWSIRNEASKLIQPVSKCKNILIFYKELIQNTYDKYTNQKITETFNNDIQSQEDNLNDAIDDLAYIQFEDPEVERICHEKLHVYTYEDAKKITEIPEGIFGYNSDMKYFNEFKYFTNVLEIGDRAFEAAVSLKEIIIPDRVSIIGAAAFNGCYDLQEINIPTNIETISNGAFYHCHSLNKVNIPNGVTEIQDYAFAHCENLKTIDLSKVYKLKGSHIFNGCYNLKTVYVSQKLYDKIIKNPKQFSQIRNVIKIKDDSNSINETFNNEIQSQKDNINNAINGLGYIPFKDSLVEQICHEKLHVYTYEDAASCPNINNVFENTDITSFDELKYFTRITTINKNAFSFCTNLTSIIIPENVISIEEEAFYSCQSLKNIKFPNKLEKIGKEAFTGNLSLDNIVFPLSLKYLGIAAFSECENLTSMNISSLNLLSEIPDECFCDDCNLIKVILPKNIKKLGSRCFMDCSYLKEIQLPDGLNEIKYSAFAQCSELTNINIPDSVEKIGIRAFADCTNLKEISLPNNQYFNTIPPYMFSGCNYLRHIEIPNQVTVIKRMAFEKCKYLYKIILPNSLRTLSSIAFYQCPENMLIFTPKDKASYVEDQLMDGGFYKENINIQIKSDTINETFNNDIQSQEDNLNDAIDDLAYIQFEDPEIEKICHEQLHVYTYEDAKKVTNLCNFGRNIKYFNELKYFTNLKKINDYAFVTCSQLKQITLPDSITEIGECAFSGCTNLLKINIPKNVIKIDAEAFFYCQSLKQIINSNDECKIGEEAFGYCGSLEEIILPKNITEIPDSAFLYCSSLKHINIPNKVTKIGDAAFYQCESLQHINIPNKVIKIGNNAFEYCKSLQSIIIPDNIMEIGQDVFTYCDNLKNIYVSKENYTKLRKYKFRNFLKIVDNNNSNLINETFNNEIQSKDEPNIDQAIENISVSKNIISQDKFYQLLLKFLKNNKFIDESKESVLGVKQWYGHHEKGYYYNKYLSPKVENENEIYSMHTLNIVLVDIPQINEDTEQHQHDIVYIKILSNPNLDYDIDKDSNTFNITLNYAPNILLKDDLSYNKTKFNYKIQYPVLDMNYEKMISLNGYFTYRMSTAAIYDIKNIITKMFYNNNYLKDLLINDYEVLGYPCLDDVRFKKYIDAFLNKCNF